MDSLGINLSDWLKNAPNPNLFTHSGVRNTTIRNNELYYLGFRTDNDNAIGLLFQFANQLRFGGQPFTRNCPQWWTSLHSNGCLHPRPSRDA
jgi:hypothetical protein